MKHLSQNISWLSFNLRVSDETYKNIPLADKVMFHGITWSNIDEFLKVRYPNACMHKKAEENIDSLSDSIRNHISTLHDRFWKFNKKHKLIRSVASLSKKQRKWAAQYFRDNVFPVLSTITFDRKKTLNLHAGFYVLVQYECDGDRHTGYVEIPSRVDRFIQVPEKNYLIAVEDMIRHNIEKLFYKADNCRVTPFAIARSAEVMISMDEYTDDPFTLIQKTLKERDRAWITYLEIDSRYDKSGEAQRILKGVLPLSERTVIFRDCFIHMMDLKKVPGSVYRFEDQSRKYEPVITVPQDKSIFSWIKKEDQLLFHPYESYQASMVKFLEDASVDPDVLSIKITLYRVSDNSRIIDALLTAANKGKTVTVLVELKARFDEQHNIEISKILREGGVRLVFTRPDMKTHAKVCIVTRKESKGIRTYVHVGTGNYSESNSKQYTDYSYFSCNPELGKDLTQFFNLLTSEQGTFKSRRVIYAPYNMREELEEQIDKQVKLAKKGKRARIIAKCNSLTDPKMADCLVDAANAGVKVILIIRGSCIIEPRKNLKIYSIVGMYLEHSRVYWFGYGRHSTVFIGSSDLMTRNLSGRREVLLKVENRNLKKRLMQHLKWYISDTVNRRIILPGYQYKNAKGKKHPVNVQELCRKEAKHVSY